MKWMRLIAPWILLAAYMPLVIQSSLHVHHDTVDIQDECPQCEGHFTTQHHHHNDCQYCHFLGLNYLKPNARQLLIPDFGFRCPVAEVRKPQKVLSHGVSQLRAPPFHYLSRLWYAAGCEA